MDVSNITTTIFGSIATIVSVGAIFWRFADKIDKRFDKVDDRMERIEAKLGDVDKRLAVVEAILHMIGIPTKTGTDK